MKEILSCISSKILYVMTLLAILLVTIVYVVFIYPNSTSVYTDKILSTLAVADVLLVGFISYRMYNLIKGGSMFKGISEILNDELSEGDQIFNTISDGIIVVDTKGWIRNINQGLCNILGIREEHFLGKNISDPFNQWGSDYESNLLPKILMDSLESQKEFRQLEQIYPRDEDILYLSISTYLLRNKYKKMIGVLAVVQDLTQEKRLEQNLVRAEKLANAGQMAAELAHEIKNPICSIKGLIQIMGRKYSLEDSKYYEMITSEIDRISFMLQRFLALTQDEPKLENIGINCLVEQIVPLLESYAESKNINIDVDMQKQIPHINADSENIRQVIINIVQNGIDALPEKGKINISIWYDQINDLLKMEFKDNGSGIKPEFLDKIFEPFFTTKPNGSGLGLAISHKIIENHKGRLFAFNNLDGGATFVIELPVDKYSDRNTNMIS